MVAALRLTGTERVLEIGTGSGYGAAVLSRLAREVHTVERLSELADRARRRLVRLGYQNVHVHLGDGSLGWPEHAPYDAICLTAAARRLPQPLSDQLADGGRIVAPLGDLRGGQRLMRITRHGHDWRHEDLGAFAFVPLIGAQAWRAEEIWKSM
jgi:protein-L-isoaspartate(D-aspartate) O-methyltransferase